MNKLITSLIKRTLRRGKETTDERSIPRAKQTTAPDDAYLLIVFFNLESVWGFGHCILGLGPMNGDIQTYSFYRNSKRIIAPAKVASMIEPMSFESICQQSGWITHGVAGEYWNEHMTCCLAFWCTRDVYEKVDAYITAIKEHPGTYLFFTRNCVHIVLQSLVAGGVHLLTRKSRDIRTIIPRRVYSEFVSETTAHPYGSGRYWFKTTEPPQNGYSTRELIVKDKP